MEGQRSSVLVTADSDAVKVWDVESAKETAQMSVDQVLKEASSLNVVKRDPHNNKMLGAAVDEQIAIFDIRTEGKGLSFLAHEE